MTKIIRLSKNIANQIAAWEVVERPISIVKELIENSIDANATNIKIEIKLWWIDEIIIEDNWEWINKNDIELSIEKYSTSKIKSLQDIYNIMTFWFRWEALSSISSVSKFQIISKTKEADYWYSLYSEWWENWIIEKNASEIWTKIIIKNLFFNTPARLNYLKAPKTEHTHIYEFINEIALSYPNIWFEFISDWRKILKYKNNESIKTRIYSIFSEDFYINLLKIDFSIPWININWFISDPKISFNNKNKQSIFVNHRIIKSPLIYKAIYNAYNRYIPHWSNPWYILNINIDPTQIDVNVHPRKLEIRFANEQNIYKSVYNLIENTLNKSSLISHNNNWNTNINSDFKSQQNQNFTESSQNYYIGSWTKFKSYSPYKNIANNPHQWAINEAIIFTDKIFSLNKEENLRPVSSSPDLHVTSIWKIIWQSHNSYIIVETNNWLKILDQHALAERIIYEKLINNEKKTQTQQLLIWESIQLSPKDINIIEDNKSTFNNMWFDYELMSWWIIIINWIPDFIKKENIKSIFEWIINDIWEYWLTKSKTLDEVNNKIYAYTACRSAIKFWNKLNIFEMNKLLNEAILDYSLTCPHWRPVLFEIWLDELKWKYER